MILPNFTDKQILTALIADQPELKRSITKRVKNYYADSRKRGLTPDDEIVYCIENTSAGNNWLVSVRFKKDKTSYWNAMKCCVVEKNGTKEYYFLRGLSNNQPYFISFTSHAIKRILERGLKHSEIAYENGLNRAYFITRIFDVHEIAVSMKDVPLRFKDIYLNLDVTEKDYDISRMIYINLGILLGYKTEHGNYLVKTYLSINELTDRFQKNTSNHQDPEQAAKTFILQKAHQLQNPSMWDELNINALNRVLGIEQMEGKTFREGENGIIILRP